MYITMLKSKIHRATVTQSELNYVGSITIDKTLMNATGLLEYEKVQIAYKKHPVFKQGAFIYLINFVTYSCSDSSFKRFSLSTQFLHTILPPSSTLSPTVSQNIQVG